MSKMIQLVEELRERLNTIADGEQKLVSSLREALSRFDQKLLQDVRSITAEHESRRSAILNELQGLASRMGAFPPPRDVRLGANGSEGAAPPLPPNPNARLRAVEGGAWREATDKLQTELDSYFRKRA
jgi:hypothetical protein